MSTTWSRVGSHAVKATCTTGTEAAPSAATDGISLEDNGGLASIGVHAEAATAMTEGGFLRAYVYNPVGNVGAGQWNRAPDLDLRVRALGAQGFPGYSVPNRVGRLAYVPDGVGVAVVVYLNGTRRSR